MKFIYLLKLAVGEILAILAFIGTLVADRIRITNRMARIEERIEDLEDNMIRVITQREADIKEINLLSQQFAEMRADMRGVVERFKEIADKHERFVEKYHSQVTEFFEKYEVKRRKD